MGVFAKLLPLALDYATRIPFERLIIKTPDKTKHLKELQEILEQSPKQSAAEPTEEAIPEEEDAGIVRSQSHHVPMESTVTLQETIDYHKKEIGKSLLRMEMHYAQGLRINGRVCDCGAAKHLLYIEAIAEETIPMVKEGGIYQKLIDWVNEVGPESTVEAVSSGEYDQDYPVFSGEARDFRKELLGTLEVKALFSGTSKGRFAGFKVKVEKPEPEALESPENILSLLAGEPTAGAELPVDIQQPEG